MKHKLLINGRKSALTKEFFVHADDVFESMSTSDVWEDIAVHFKYFEPDGYVFCPDYYSPEAVNHLLSMKKTFPYCNVPIFIFGEPDVCDTFEERTSGLADMYIKRPISINSLSKLITNFYIDLEDKKKKEAEAAAALAAEKERIAAEIAAASKKHILIIDDDRSVLKLLKSCLEPKYDVTTMISGRMAQKFLENRTTDLILLDYEMPLENGPEVFRKIRSDDRLVHIPIVFLTGVADSSKIKQVLELKPQGYLLKPIEMDRLTSTISEIIG